MNTLNHRKATARLYLTQPNGTPAARWLHAPSGFVREGLTGS